MNDESIMPFGIHKGKPMSDVPDSYLLWLWENKVETWRAAGIQTDLIAYLDDNIEAIKQNAGR